MPIFNFTEFERLRDRIDELVEISNNNQDKWAIVTEFLNDVLDNTEDSEFFFMTEPLSVNTEQSYSQIRIMTEDPDHIRNLKNSIISRGMVFKPILTFTPRAGIRGKTICINGVHRTTATRNAIEEGDLPDDFKIPSVNIPTSLFDRISSVVPIIQAILNDDQPSLPNNDNDVKKFIDSHVGANEIDLSDEESYESVLRLLKCVFSNKSERSLKNNLTRRKNTNNRNNGHIWSKTPEEFVDAFRNTAKSSASFKQVKCVSNKGSSRDQLVYRSHKKKFENPNDKIVWLLIDQNNKGSFEEAITSRKNFWMEVKKMYNIYGSSPIGLPFDSVVVVPQIQKDYEFEVENQKTQEIIKYNCKTENHKISGHWKEITSLQICSFYRMNPDLDYDPQWLSYSIEKKSSRPLLTNFQTQLLDALDSLVENLEN